jgi:hypothetical protein
VSAYPPPSSKKRRTMKKTIQKTRNKYTAKKWIINPSMGLTAPRSTPMSRRVRTTLTYFEKRIGCNPGVAGIAADQVFSLNSLFDPYVTGVGHQPAGFDEMMNLFRYYVVVGARAHITFQNTDSTNEALVVSSVSTTSTPLTELQNVVENGRCNYQLLSKAGDSRSITDMRLAVSIPAEMGPKDPIDNPDLWGTSSASPISQLFLHCTAQPNSTADSGIVGLTVVIQYDVVFFEPNTVASS